MLNTCHECATEKNLSTTWAFEPQILFSLFSLPLWYKELINKLQLCHRPLGSSRFLLTFIVFLLCTSIVEHPVLLLMYFRVRKSEDSNSFSLLHTHTHTQHWILLSCFTWCNNLILVVVVTLEKRKVVNY